jgi:hypothetical protein
MASVPAEIQTMYLLNTNNDVAATQTHLVGLYNISLLTADIFMDWHIYQQMCVIFSYPDHQCQVISCPTVLEEHKLILVTCLTVAGSMSFPFY